MPMSDRHGNRLYGVPFTPMLTFEQMAAERAAAAERVRRKRAARLVLALHGFGAMTVSLDATPPVSARPEAF